MEKCLVLICLSSVLLETALADLSPIIGLVNNAVDGVSDSDLIKIVESIEPAKIDPDIDADIDLTTVRINCFKQVLSH